MNGTSTVLNTIKTDGGYEMDIILTPRASIGDEEVVTWDYPIHDKKFMSSVFVSQPVDQISVIIAHTDTEFGADVVIKNWCFV